MAATESNGVRSALSFGAAVCIGALAVLGAGVGARQESVAMLPAPAQTVARSVADLEKAFWVCDYVATTRGVEHTPADVCVAVTEDLKNGKFEGDFEALVAWWRDNKVAEHQSLRERERLNQPASVRVR
jgi:hypothetical protein